MNRLHRNDFRHWLAAHSAPWMFSLSLAFLVCQAILVVVWVDVPNLSENALSTIDPTGPEAAAFVASLHEEIVDHRVQETTTWVMMMIWPLIIAESFWHWITRGWDRATRRYHAFGLLFCLCPSLRMCARSPEMHHRLWLPGLGWRQSNRRLRKRLERKFSVPMIAIAMLIMPVLVIEFFMKTQVAQHTWLRMSLHISTGVIWLAFAAEFILMVSVADKKLAYCRKHWIDLAIISLPIFSFLRSLQVLRATRVANVLRIQQLTKLARVYRLRGTAVKALRAFVLLDLFKRYTEANPTKTIDRLQTRLTELENETEQIRRRIVKLKRLDDRSNED